MAASDDSNEFDDLGEGLANWASSKNCPELWPEVKKVAASLAERLGEIIKVHIPQKEGYIGLTFATMPEKIGAYVSVGYIEHVIELDGSFPSETSPGYWRTQLKSAFTSKSPVYDSKMDSFACPKHNTLITKYAKCPICEWSPSDVV